MHWLLFALLINDNGRKQDRTNQLLEQQMGIEHPQQQPSLAAVAFWILVGLFFAWLLLYTRLTKVFGTGSVAGWLALLIVAVPVVLACVVRARILSDRRRDHQQSVEQERPVPQGWLN